MQSSKSAGPFTTGFMLRHLPFLSLSYPICPLGLITNTVAKLKWTFFLLLGIPCQARAPKKELQAKYQFQWESLVPTPQGDNETLLCLEIYEI